MCFNDKIQCDFILLGFIKHFFKILIIHFYGEEEGGRNRGRATLMWEALIGCLLYVPQLRPDLRPRHVPSPGIELVTFCFAGQRPTNWATPVRAGFVKLLIVASVKYKHTVILQGKMYAFLVKLVLNTLLQNSIYVFFFPHTHIFSFNSGL